MADAAVAIAVLPPAARFAVRVGDAVAEAIGAAFGVPLPRDVCRAAIVGDRAALWLGPDEWLLIAPEAEGEALAATLTQAPGGEPASIVEVSDRNIGVEVSGAKAAEIISAFNPLDLDLAAFPVGMCTRTVFAKAEVVLWRTTPDAFRIEVWRSFAPYVQGSLSEAAREYLD